MATRGYVASGLKPYAYMTLAVWTFAALHKASPWLIDQTLGWLDELDHLDVFGTVD